MNHDLTLLHGNQDPTAKRVATGLGWFSIALGCVELFATRQLAKALGMETNETLLRCYGAREVATGIGILLAKDPTPWIWGRVLGDAADLGTLAAHLTDDNDEEENVGIAMGNVAAVMAADVWCAQRLGCTSRDASTNQADYSKRSGFPQSATAMKGAASDFETPGDMRPPEAMRPYDQGGAAPSRFTA